MSALVITGASSFLGRALLSELPAEWFPELRILVHDQPAPAATTDRRVIAVRGDLLDAQTLRTLITPGATVVHLAFLATSSPADDNLAAVRNLLAACRHAGIKRMVHCSTAVVAGNVPDDVITEESPCRPYTEYERVKYRIEQEMRDAAAGQHEITIVRPTQAFGPGGRNLSALAGRVRSGNGVVNFAFSALQGRRRMNLVSVHNVAAALGFLVGTGQAVDQQAYIVSDDRDPLNNYQDVERILMRELDRERSARVMALPPVLLSAALRARGRSNTNPGRIYSDDKLKAAGFVKPWPFEAALVDYAKWLRTQYDFLAAAR